MPRIPSAADVSSIGASSARLPTVRASAEDFGLNAAEGLMDFATGIDAAGKFLDDLVKAGKKREEAQQSVDAGQHVAETREESNQLLDRWDYGGSSPQEAAAQSSRELEAWEDTRLQQMPLEQRPVLKAATASIRQGHGLRLAQRAQNAAVAAMSQQTDETLRLIQEQAVREPEAAAHYAAEGQAQLQSLLEAGALTTEQFARQEQAFRRKLYAKVVRGQPAVRALADLEDGIYDAGLDDPALKRALTEETAWRLQSETAQGAAAADARLARVRRGEASAGGLSASSQAIFAAGEMGDAELQAEIAFRVNSEMQRLRYAPVAEIGGRPEDLAPSIGTPDADTRHGIRQEVWIQSQAMLRERRRDPAAYVMGQPAVAEAFAAAAKNPALLPDAIAARLAAQAAMGLTQDQQNALALEERTRVVAGLRQLPPAQRLAAVMELGQTYGDQSGAVVSDLAEAGLTVDELFAADPSGGPEVAGILAQATQSRGEGKAPEGDVIKEAAERLIGEGRERFGTPSSSAQKRLEEIAPRELPSVPLRKPESSGLPGKRQDLGDEGGSPETSYLIGESEVLEKYRDLMGGADAKEFEFRLRSPAVEDFVRELDRQAVEAKASPEIRELFKRLTLYKMLRSRLSAEEARKSAAAEVGINEEEAPLGEAEARMGEPERQVRDLLSLMTSGYPADIHDPDRALALIREVMGIRRVDEAGRGQALEDLLKKLHAELEGTNDRFLFPVLRDAATRALHEPHLAPWALTDSELVGVYEAVERSSDLLGNASAATAPVGLVSLPAGLVSLTTGAAGWQQGSLRKAYERELRRRGFLKRPGE